jgi:3' terminal RNA ribose 2'-O-methyltransferase Hen1
MLLSITTTHQPATDLGYLLHKHPERAQQFSLSFGTAHVFYPEASQERCTACLLLEVDPVALVRGRGGLSLSQYVNDRPYAASSFLSVALAKVFGTAMGGRSKGHEALAATPIPLEATLTAVPARGGADLIRRLFEPLGYEVEAQTHALDPAFPAWGESRYHTLRLCATIRLADLLTHLYVLIPALDAEKHYWVGEDEVEKLVRKGEGWLESHPEQRLIASRYLKRRRSLVRQALSQLAPEDEVEDSPGGAVETALEAQMKITEGGAALVAKDGVPLYQQRYDAVKRALKESGARRVLDLGCAEGKLLRELLEDAHFEEIVGVDVSVRALEHAKTRLRLDRRPEAQAKRVRLVHGSLLYRDERLTGYDAAVAAEVIEHLDETRLDAFERSVFETARPQTVVVTTPNREFNALFAQLPSGRFRHADHRFEWTREEFAAWAGGVAGRRGYRVRFEPVGPVHEAHGPPTQMAVFERQAD